MAEFALLLPIFMTIVMGVFEFAFVFNAVLGVNFATRGGALMAAEASNSVDADCLILQQVERDITSPVDRSRITEVRIYWSTANGDPVGTAANVYTRTGTTTCTSASGVVRTVPYRITSAGYPPSARCNIVNGCSAAHPVIDTIGVRVTYAHAWVTPLRNLVPLGGSGYTITRSNAMRMEPVL